MFIAHFDQISLMQLMCKKYLITNSKVAKTADHTLLLFNTLSFISMKVCSLELKPSTLVWNNNSVCGRPATLLKKQLQYRCFPVNFAKFLRTPFFLWNAFGGYFRVFCNKCSKILESIKITGNVGTK